MHAMCKDSTCDLTTLDSATIQPQERRSEKHNTGTLTAVKRG